MKISEYKKRKLSLFSIHFTYFLDNLGWSIVFPIFAPLFLDPQNLIFSQNISIATRTTFLGIFLGAFPFAQFLGSPILGELIPGFKRFKVQSSGLSNANFPIYKGL